MTSQRTQGGQHDLASDRRMAESIPEAVNVSTPTTFTETASVPPMERTSKGRKKLSLKTKLASAIAALFEIPYEHQKLMHEDQILSLVEWHHNILHSTTPIDTHWNVGALLLAEHKARFPIDAAVAAKIKRLRGETCTTPAKPIPQRANPWPPKGARKFASAP